MLRAIIQAGVMVLFQGLGTAVPRTAGQRLVTRDTVVNLLTGLGLFAFSAALVRPFSQHSELGLVDTGWLSAGWMQLLFAWILSDFCRYWLHRAHHRVSFLWLFHRVHHSAETMDATLGLRMHLVDFVQLSLVPILLFGVIFDTSHFEDWVMTAMVGIVVSFDAFQHSNLRLDVNNPLFKAWHRVFNNPHFHCWHHTRDGHLCDGNYSQAIVLWDRLFGTEVTQPEPPPLYGLEGDQRLVNGALAMQLLRRPAPTTGVA